MKPSDINTQDQVPGAGLPAPPASVPARPTYAAAFRCIGADCEDTCCREWSIPVDRETYRRYEQFPAERLGAQVRQYVSITPAAPDSLYARIQPAPSGYCGFLGEDRLCGIQKEYGGALLSASCSAYPRELNRVQGVLEGSLSLSCPEAARNVLLVPGSMRVAGNLLSGEFRTDHVLRLGGSRNGSHPKPYYEFQPVRALLVAMVRDRERPLWQRMLLIGSLCLRLDATSTSPDDEAVLHLLEEYRQVIENRWLHTELEALPSHLEIRLKVVRKLSEDRAQGDAGAARFRDTFRAFTEGIGWAAGAPPEEVAQRYREAEDRYSGPFLARSPFILENYLLNYIFKNLFPFGREGSPHSRSMSMFEEFVLLATQFGWISALLVGVAGHYREAFAGEHVVQTVQAYSRAVDHSPAGLVAIVASMRNWGMDSLHGMSVMLRS